MVARQIGADVVHSHFGHIGWTNLSAVNAAHARHVVTFYGFDVSKLPAQDAVWRSRYRELFDQADLFLCEGTHMAGDIMKLGAPHEKVRVQHLGVDVRRFDFRPRQWRPAEPLKVLIAASFKEKKGIPYAIEALGRVRKSQPIELTVIGDATPDAASQQEKAKVMRALQKGGLEARTRLLGFQPHSTMLEEAYRHHIFLQPSVVAGDGDTEGGAPVSIIEMLATGMPVVSTLHCDIPEVMGPALRHLLAPERDTDALLGILTSLIANHADWPSIIAAGRSRMEAEYDLTIQARRQLEHYKRLL
jgi:colanic acid/amylovoran biosynthesis glycosyltransferase